jgi:hypothetical protein
VIKKFAVITSLAILTTILVQDAGMTKRVFDTELMFNPRSGQSYHYAQQTRLRGSEISFQRVKEFSGMIQTIFDETCKSNSNGIISTTLQYQTYEVLGETSGVWDEQPFGGPFGPGRGPYSSAPYEPPSGSEGPERGEGSPSVQSAPENEGPQPMQGMGPGSGGGGGDEWGQQQRREESDSFRITPILETQLNYTISQDGRLLDMEGLDLIGDFYDPQNQISVRQVFQSSHFLTLPSYEIHVGESWRGPFFWTIPFVGETRKFDMQFTLEEIEIQERYRLANIAFYGIDQFDTVTTDEKWDDFFGTDVRIDSDVHCDVMLNGNILFDIDRGIVVAIGDDLRTKQWIPYINPNSFPVPYGQNNLLSTIVVDRMDTKTPLGNVLDNEPRTDHIVQDMVWSTWLILE